MYRSIQLIIAGFCILGMASHVALGQNRLRHFTSADGMQGNRVNALLQDQFGFIWIETEGDELLQYDGYVFQAYDCRCLLSKYS